MNKMLLMGTDPKTISLNAAKQADAVALYDVNKATGTGLPTNSPITSPLMNLIEPPNKAVTVSNLLGTDGNFGTDSNADGLGNGWTNFQSSTTLSVSGNIQNFTPTAQYGGIYKGVTFSVGDIIYACGYVSSTSSNTNIIIGDADSNPIDIAYHSGSGNFEFLSARVITTASSALTRVYFSSNKASTWSEIKVKNAHVINLTALFGTGKELGKTTLDILMQNSINVDGYFSSRSIDFSRVYLSNLLGTDGNFESDGNADGVADNWTATALTTTSIASNVQKFTGTANTAELLHTFSSINGDIYYNCAYVKVTASAGNLVYLRMGVNITTSDAYHTGGGSYEFLSNRSTATATGSTSQTKIRDSRSSNWSEIEVRQAYTINLSQLFGRGNEPTKAQLDYLMQNEITNNGYFSTKSSNIKIWGHAFLINFAGTTASGYDLMWIPSSYPTKTLTNLLGSDGNFGTDSNADGLGNGWTAVTLATNSMGSNIQTVKASAQNGGITNTQTVAVGDVVYACAYVSIASSSVSFGINYGSDSLTAHSASAGYEFLSGYGIATSTTLTTKLVDARASTWTDVAIKQIHTFNLTSIFGTSIPTKAQMDELMKTVIAMKGYVTSQGICQEEFVRCDGSDDIMAIMNTYNLDAVNAPIAVFGTLRLPSTLVAGYWFMKNDTSTATGQYGTTVEVDGSANCVVDGASRKGHSGGTIKADTICDMGFIWNGSTVETYYNYTASGNPLVYNTQPVTSRANTQIGARHSTTTTYATFYKGWFANITVYQGENATPTKILKHRKLQSKRYLG